MASILINGAVIDQIILEHVTKVILLQHTSHEMKILRDIDNFIYRHMLMDSI